MDERLKLYKELNENSVKILSIFESKSLNTVNLHKYMRERKDIFEKLKYNYKTQGVLKDEQIYLEDAINKTNLIREHLVRLKTNMKIKINKKVANARKITQYSINNIF